MSDYTNYDFNYSIGSTVRSWLNNPERRKLRMESKDAKNRLKQSEAALNEALAQSAMASARQGSGGSNAGMVIGIVVGVLALAGTIGFIVYKRSK